MPSIILILPIILPVLCGLAVMLLKNERLRNIFVLSATIINSLLVAVVIAMRPDGNLTLVYFTKSLTVSFKMDGLACIYSGMVAVLWPLATLYALEYMKKHEHKQMFFMFYLITYGVTLGIASADNYITMYIFYELLTLVTLPLVMHTLTREAIKAGRKYLYYSLGGSAFAFIGLIFIVNYGISTEFTLGGVLSPQTIEQSRQLLEAVYVLTFMGFGVKSALFPLHGWLPTASVAPVPVTALLHAVAVVKSGVFAIMRVTYYSFGTDFLRGSWAQTIVMCAALITILYGSAAALRETHLKRRLAYSTVSNLSYILFGVAMMNPIGLTAALIHMLAHSFTKITAFFCCGSVMEQSGKEYIQDMDGFWRTMPFTFTCFTIAALSLIGIPPLGGFVSKWQLISAAISDGGTLELIGIAVLLISAFLTAIYMLNVVVRAFARPAAEGITAPHESGIFINISIGTLAAITLFFGFTARPLAELLYGIACGTIL